MNLGNAHSVASETIWLALMSFKQRSYKRGCSIVSHCGNNNNVTSHMRVQKKKNRKYNSTVMRE